MSRLAACAALLSIALVARGADEALKPILDLHKANKLFDKTEYKAVRSAAAKVFEARHADVIKDAFGTDHEALSAWLDKQKDLKEELYQRDRPQGRRRAAGARHLPRPVEGQPGRGRQVPEPCHCRKRGLGSAATRLRLSPTSTPHQEQLAGRLHGPGSAAGVPLPRRKGKRGSGEGVVQPARGLSIRIPRVCGRSPYAGERARMGHQELSCQAADARKDLQGDRLRRGDAADKERGVQAQRQGLHAGRHQEVRRGVCHASRLRGPRRQEPGRAGRVRRRGIAATWVARVGDVGRSEGGQ